MLENNLTYHFTEKKVWLKTMIKNNDNTNNLLSNLRPEKVVWRQKKIVINYRWWKHN